MNDGGQGADFDDQLERLQGLLTALEGLSDPAAQSAARELVQVVIDLHRTGLSDLLAIVAETAAQPADTLVAKFAANPAVRGLMILHGLHPEDLATRARQAVERLRPHLGVQGVRADLVHVADGVIRIRVTPSGQKSQRPAVHSLKQEIEDSVLELAPDASGIAIEGMEATSGAQEAYVPITAVSRARTASQSL